MELLLLYLVSWPLATTYIACEIGEQLNTEFSNICELIDQLKWYLFPINVQKILPLIIISVQTPIDLECFGSISCSREVFNCVSQS